MDHWSHLYAYILLSMLQRNLLSPYLNHHLLPNPYHNKSITFRLSTRRHRFIYRLQSTYIYTYTRNTIANIIAYWDISVIDVFPKPGNEKRF